MKCISAWNDKAPPPTLSLRYVVLLRFRAGHPRGRDRAHLGDRRRPGRERQAGIYHPGGGVRGHLQHLRSEPGGGDHAQQGEGATKEEGGEKRVETWADFHATSGFVYPFQAWQTFCLSPLTRKLPASTWRRCVCVEQVIHIHLAFLLIWLPSGESVLMSFWQMNFLLESLRTSNPPFLNRYFHLFGAKIMVHP